MVFFLIETWSGHIWPINIMLQTKNFYEKILKSIKAWKLVPGCFLFLKNLQKKVIWDSLHADFDKFC